MKQTKPVHTGFKIAVRKKKKKVINMKVFQVLMLCERKGKKEKIIKPKMAQFKKFKLQFALK